MNPVLSHHHQTGRKKTLRTYVSLAGLSCVCQTALLLYKQFVIHLEDLFSIYHPETHPVTWHFPHQVPIQIPYISWLTSGTPSGPSVIWHLYKCIFHCTIQNNFRRYLAVSSTQYKTIIYHLISQDQIFIFVHLISKTECKHTSGLPDAFLSLKALLLPFA